MWYNADMEESIEKILSKYGVVLGYLFGSHARGTAGPLSDIDVAVSFSRDISDEEQDEKVENIRSEIQKEFKTDFVDVINLNKNQNILLGHRIVFGGKPLVIKDRKTKQILESKYLHEYEDTRYMRADQFKILKNYYVSN